MHTMFGNGPASEMDPMGTCPKLAWADWARAHTGSPKRAQHQLIAPGPKEARAPAGLDPNLAVLKGAGPRLGLNIVVFYGGLEGSYLGSLGRLLLGELVDGLFRAMSSRPAPWHVPTTTLASLPPQPVTSLPLPHGPWGLGSLPQPSPQSAASETSAP